MTKMEIGEINHHLPSYPTLTFIADMSHTVAETNSIYFAMLFLQAQNFLN